VCSRLLITTSRTQSGFVHQHRLFPHSSTSRKHLPRNILFELCALQRVAFIPSLTSKTSWMLRIGEWARRHDSRARWTTYFPVYISPWAILAEPFLVTREHVWSFSVRSSFTFDQIHSYPQLHRHLGRQESLLPSMPKLIYQYYSHYRWEPNSDSMLMLRRSCSISSWARVLHEGGRTSGRTRAKRTPAPSASTEQTAFKWFVCHMFTSLSPACSIVTCKKPTYS
jgi:hypothetical protein